jgi:hypothetical protein
VIWRCLKARDRRRAPCPYRHPPCPWSPTSFTPLISRALSCPRPTRWGLLNGLHNYWVVLFSLTITGFPFAFLLTPSYLSRIDPSFERAAATLGAGHRQRFWHVTVRLLAPGLATTFALPARAPLHAHDPRGAGDRACGSSTRRTARVAATARNRSERTRSPASSAASCCGPTCFGVRTSSPPSGACSTR